jgi:antitoxin HicB
MYQNGYIKDVTKSDKKISVVFFKNDLGKMPVKDWILGFSPDDKKIIGDSFDSFLKDEGILEQVEDIAIKRVIAFQLQEEMKKKNITKAKLAQQMKTSRSSLDRLLDPENEAVTFKTLKKAANVLGKKLIIQLV